MRSPDHQDEPHLTVSLSFGDAADDEGVTAATDPTCAVPIDLPDAADKDTDADTDYSSDDFEFTFVAVNPEALTSVTANEIFSGGRILPAYPLFDRDLLLPLRSDEEARDAAADNSNAAQQIPLQRLLLEEVEAPPETSSSVQEAAGEYCVWSPDGCKKSASTGSSMPCRLRDFMAGRSHSDGKKFVFLQTAAAPKERSEKSSASAAKATPGKGAEKAVKVKEMDVVTAHRLYYGKGANEQAVKGQRRSYLPYRQQLFGFFAPVSNLHRSNHPF